MVTRSPMVAIASEWELLVQMTQGMLSDSLGIADSKLFCEALGNARHTSETQIVPLIRAIGIEAWLRALRVFEESECY